MNFREEINTTAVSLQITTTVSYFSIFAKPNIYKTMKASSLMKQGSMIAEDCFVSKLSELWTLLL